MANAILFEDLFEIEKLNECGKKFERGLKIPCDYHHSYMLCILYIQ